MSGAGLQRDCDISPACVDNALREDGAEFGHDVFVFVGDDLGVGLSEEGDFGAGLLGVLDEDHRGGDESALPDEVDGVEHEHGFEQGDGLAQAGARARDAEGHGCAVTDVGVVAFGEERHHAGALLGSPGKEDRISIFMIFNQMKTYIIFNFSSLNIT